jgi:uncharacterized delta-60 repeat protein
MRFLIASVVSLFLFLSLNPRAQAQKAGSLDSSFGVNGAVSNRIGKTHDKPYDIVIQADSSILLGGAYTNDSTGSNDLVIVRYLPNGRIDSSYGKQGMVRFSLAPVSNTSVASLVLQPDGKLVFFGTSHRASDDYSKWLVGRITPQGNFDGTFGHFGYVELDLGRTASANKIVMLSSGDFMIGGSVGTFNSGMDVALAHLKSNGTYDSTFGKNGVVIDPINTGNDWISTLLIQPDGRILAGGASAFTNSYAARFTIIRYEQNGVRDSSYGVNGLALFSLSQSDAITDMGFQSNGKVVALGTSYTSSTDWGLARFDTSGQPDLTFGSNGIVQIGTLKGEDNATRITVLPDDRFYVGGNIAADQTAPWYFAVSRFIARGALDGSFGTSGTASAMVLNSCTPAGMAVQQNGKIIMSGYAWNQGSLEQEDFAMVRFHGDPPVIPTAITNKSQANDGWVLFPNPAQDALWLRNEGGNQAGSYQLLNAFGQTLQQGILDVYSDSRIQLQSLPSGNYWIRVQTANKVSVCKFLKK